MNERTRIVPAVESLGRALLRGLGAPLDRCLPGGAAGVARIADELSQLVLDMALSPLSTEEARTFSAWTGQDLLAQSLEAPLARCRDVQEATGATPEEGARLRGFIGEMARTEECARLFRLGVRGAERFVRGLMAFGCVRLMEALEAGIGASPEAHAQVLAETAALRARVRAMKERQEAAAARGEAELEPLREAAEAAEAALRAAGTLEEVRRGGRPGDEAVLEAAEMLSSQEAPPSARPDRRRKPR